jgi:hypothetical protein
MNFDMRFRSWGTTVLFGLTSFLGAVLFFSVQPMIGKMVLPVLGGTPAVWNTCLVYFQAILLCGYLLTHGVGPREGMELRRVSVIYLLALAVLLASGYYVQPVVIQPNRGVHHRADAHPALALLEILWGSATLPLVVVAATAPLAQCWFALTGQPRARDPYFLYAASNAGSLLALLAYPFVVEPNLGLTAQSRLWRTGFLILAILLVCCGLVARRLSQSRPVSNAVGELHPLVNRGRGPAQADQGTGPTLGKPLRWIILVFISSSWLLGVTTYLTTELASIPLLWMIPLALYLLSFVIAFAGSEGVAVRAATWVLPYLVVPLVLAIAAGFVHASWIPLHLLAFFAGSLACHGSLVRARPAAPLASAFYVTIGVGGLLGGIWSALVAPLVFDRVVEYPLAVVLACLAARGVKADDAGGTIREWTGDLVFAGVVFLLAWILATNQAGIAENAVGVLSAMAASGMGVLACVTAGRRPVRFALVLTAVLVAAGLSQGPGGRLLHAERDFFGVLRVTHDAERNVRRLFHGSTLHGEQSLDPVLRREPSTYFTRSGPIGQVLGAIERRMNRPAARVAIVGLGAGTMASYARPGQRWTFYELDAAVERIAGDPRFFTYLQDCPAGVVDILVGDARQRLRDAPDHAYRLIAVDAFSSDAVPVHLLAREAIRLYREKLADGGLLAFHLSNRYVDFDPVIGRQAEDAGLVCRLRYDLAVNDDEARAGKQPSIWAVMAATDGDLGDLVADPRWQPPALRPGSAVWTDDFSDLASYLMLAPGRLRSQRAAQAK